jgi:hypothetical protein
MYVESQIAEKTPVDPDMLNASQKGETKRKLVQTDFAEENTRGSIARENQSLPILERVLGC